MRLFGGTQLATAQSKAKKKAAATQTKHKFTWPTDIAKAEKIAASTNRKLFILFTGSDWCPPCQALKRNVLDKSSFKSVASKEYVFVMADFPRRKKLSVAQQDHNEKLAKKYGIRSYPTVILAKADGTKLSSMGGYSGDTPASFLKKL